jgi:hypothetical protein
LKHSRHFFQGCRDIPPCDKIKLFSVENFAMGEDIPGNLLICPESKQRPSFGSHFFLPNKAADRLFWKALVLQEH